jgi:uncharacterized membrane protein
VSAYLPHDAATVWLFLAILAMTLILGLAITTMRSAISARWAAWALVVVGTVETNRLFDQEPAGLRMLALIGVLLCAMKTVVTVESRIAGQPRLSLPRWLGFAFLWFGMRPAIFAAAGRPALFGAGSLLSKGLKNVLVGTALIALARMMWIRDAAISTLSLVEAKVPYNFQDQKCQHRSGQQASCLHCLDSARFRDQTRCLCCQRGLDDMIV